MCTHTVALAVHPAEESTNPSLGWVLAAGKSVICDLHAPVRYRLRPHSYFQLQSAISFSPPSPSKAASRSMGLISTGQVICKQWQIKQMRPQESRPGQQIGRRRNDETTKKERDPQFKRQAQAFVACIVCRGHGRWNGVAHRLHRFALFTLHLHLHGNLHELEYGAQNNGLQFTVCKWRCCIGDLHAARRKENIGRIILQVGEWAQCSACR